MELVVMGIIGLIFAVISYKLAAAKEKPSPVLWAIGGFFFNVVPLFALGAAPDPEELRQQMRKAANDEMFRAEKRSQA